MGGVVGNVLLVLATMRNNPLCDLLVQDVRAVAEVAEERHGQALENGPHCFFFLQDAFRDKIELEAANTLRDTSQLLDDLLETALLGAILN